MRRAAERRARRDWWESLLPPECAPRRLGRSKLALMCPRAPAGEPHEAVVVPRDDVVRCEFCGRVWTCATGFLAEYMGERIARKRVEDHASA